MVSELRALVSMCIIVRSTESAQYSFHHLPQALRCTCITIIKSPESIRPQAGEPAIEGMILVVSLVVA